MSDWWGERLASRNEMNRIIQPEILDTLSPAAPHAIRSRRDLCRVNSWMGNHAVMAGALKEHWRGFAPRRITELGAGDGEFLLRVARKISPLWPDVSVTLLDRQQNVTPATLAAFEQIVEHAETVVADAFDWPPTVSDIVVTNLFLHHFDEARLTELFQVISRRTKLFIAVEPRRAAWPLFCSRLLWAIGCNDVTRHDAVVSVRAGFSGNELSTLWPEKNDWRLTEQPAGAFSHLFIAQKTN